MIKPSEVINIRSEAVKSFHSMLLQRKKEMKKGTHSFSACSLLCCWCCCCRWCCCWHHHHQSRCFPCPLCGSHLSRRSSCLHAYPSCSPCGCPPGPGSSSRASYPCGRDEASETCNPVSLKRRKKGRCFPRTSFTATAHYSYATA